MMNETNNGNWFKCLLKNIWSWMNRDGENEWLEDMRGNLSIVAILFIKMTFTMVSNNEGDQFSVVCNTLSFIASLIVLLMTVSGGISLRHRFSIWLLSMCMCFTISTVAIAYINGIRMMILKVVWNRAYTFIRVLTYGLVVLLILMALISTVHFGIWIYRRKTIVQTSTTPLHKAQLQKCNSSSTTSRLKLRN